MFISMTGSVVRRISSKWGNFTFIFNSLNHQFLEIYLSLPDEFKRWEVDIHKLIRSKISRGRVNFYLEWKDGKERGDLQVNLSQLERYYSHLERIKEKFGLEDKINLPLMMQVPHIFIYNKKKFFSKNFKTFLSNNITLTLKELTEVRKKEGRQLGEDINLRIHHIRKLVKEIKNALPCLLKEHRKKLQEKISSLDNENLKERIIQELILQEGKIDITEEITRLASHLKMFNCEMKKRKSSGKKMDFISQEMLREINTMGAKISSGSISPKIINLKSELTKIREQLRNIE